MENLGDNTRLLYATLHYGKTNEMGQGTYTTPADQLLSDTFHVYTIIWDTNSFAFYLDGTHNYWKWSPNNVAYPRPSDQSFFMMFDLAVGGSWGGPPDNSTVYDSTGALDSNFFSLHNARAVITNKKKKKSADIFDKQGYPL